MAEAALERHAPQVEYVDVSERHDSYRDLIARLWADGESFVLVEHDNEIHAQVVPSLVLCDQGLCLCGGYWCVFPYPGAGDDDGDRLLYGSLGCTLFTARLLAEQPGFMDQLPVKDWRRLDCEILPRLLQLGYERCIHWPAIEHHHIRQDGRCDCRKEH